MTDCRLTERGRKCALRCLRKRSRQVCALSAGSCLTQERAEFLIWTSSPAFLHTEMSICAVSAASGGTACSPIGTTLWSFPPPRKVGSRQLIHTTVIDCASQGGWKDNETCNTMLALSESSKASAPVPKGRSQLSLFVFHHCLSSCRSLPSVFFGQSISALFFHLSATPLASSSSRLPSFIMLVTLNPLSLLATFCIVFVLFNVRSAGSTYSSFRLAPHLRLDDINLPDLDQNIATAAFAINNSKKIIRKSTARQKLFRRKDCETAQVISGDSCATLAERCGIPGPDLTKYNGDPALCSKLAPGQYVCCSPGSLPDLSPRKQADGTCAVHTVAKGETCNSIASTHTISIGNIGEWNKHTWQFIGCNALQEDQLICVSGGDPPMPAPIPNAVCGPQVSGTVKPDNISLPDALASLNPCPLKVCCNIWGQCGNTDEFCTASKSESGAPGTAAPGKNGCISNCGTEIVSSPPPAKAFAVGYFEGYAQQRPCLNMNPSEINLAAYSHLHFGFGTLSESFDVVIDKNSTDAWEQFKELSGPSLILSLGGWSFSTEAASYAIFRNGVKQEHRSKLAKSIASFVSSSGIDGVDFDWEYPGAADIPGKHGF